MLLTALEVPQHPELRGGSPSTAGSWAGAGGEMLSKSAPRHPPPRPRNTKHSCHWGLRAWARLHVGGQHLGSYFHAVTAWCALCQRCLPPSPLRKAPCRAGLCHRGSAQDTVLGLCALCDSCSQKSLAAALQARGFSPVSGPQPVSLVGCATANTG